MKFILVYDSTSSRSEAHCRALVGLGYSVWYYSNGNISAFPPNKNSRPASYDFIFLHANDPFDGASNTGPILRYGGTAVIAPGRVPRSVSPPDAMLTVAEMTAFFDLVFSTPPTPLDDAIKIVWRDNEPLLAFRLLCEAAKVVEEENTRRTAKGEQTCKTAELSNITIHAPKDLGAWLAPFGKSKPEEISQVAGMIGSGVVKEAAEKVLNAVNGSGDLPEAITDFLKLNEPQNP